MRPSAEIGSLKGSAKIASSGNASGWRRISHDERRDHDQRADSASGERAARSAGASRGPMRASALTARTSVKLRGESTGRC